jgi:hypothetical protein
VGLLVYTEIIGRTILKMRATRKPGREESFHCFAEEYMGLNKADRVYEHYRHGLAHLHEIIGAEQGIVRMDHHPDWLPENSRKAIQATGGGKIKEIMVNAYWRDFQRGLAKAAAQYPTAFLN